LDQLYTDTASPLTAGHKEDDDKEAGEYLAYVLQKFHPFANK